jgi:hypothetical protein
MRHHSLYLVISMLASVCATEEGGCAAGDAFCVKSIRGDAQVLMQKVLAVGQASDTEASTKAASCTDYTAQYREYDDKKREDALDSEGDRCSSYKDYPEQCGSHDDEDFIANEMCCNCGGGSTSRAPRSLAVNKASVFLSTSPSCPNDSSPITTLAGCRAALDMVGLSGHDYYNGASSEENWPEGCYFCEKVKGCGDGVWFNSHAGGEAVAGTRRFCQSNYDAAAVDMLFVGDSDIDHWDSAVPFPGSFNVGIGGYQCRDVIKEVDQWVEDLDPKWVVLVCGENDINGERSETEGAYKKFKTIVQKFLDDGARVIYMGTKPEPDSKELAEEYKYYDAKVRKLATELSKGETSPPFQMIDVFPSFSSKPEIFNTDGLHMSRLGYTFWNGWVKLAMSGSPCIRWMDGVCVETPDVRYD